MKAWLELLRISNLPTVWTNVIAGLVFASAFAGAVSPIPTMIVLIAASCLYLAGMVLNDLFDASIDAEERPSRPIPSGRVTRGAAAVVGWGLLLIGAALPWTASTAGGIFAGVIAVLVVLYDRLHARTAWSVLLMALCRWGLYLLGAAATVSMTSADDSIAIRDADRTFMLVGLLALPTLVHVACFSMVARGEVSAGRPACPECGQTVLTDATICPECGSDCGPAARTARSDALRDRLRGWWSTGTLALLLPFVGCGGLSIFIGSSEGYRPSGGAFWMIGISLISIVVLGWYLVDSSRHLARFPATVGRFVLRSIAVMSLYDAAIVTLVLPRALGKADPWRTEVVFAVVVCIGCFLLVRWAHRRISGT